MQVMDLSKISTDDLAFAIDQLHALENALRVQRLHYVAELDRRQAYEEDGVGSAQDWMTYRYGMDPSTARDEMQIARALEALPKIRDAISEGEISWDKARELASFVSEDDDAFWSEEAPRRAYSHVRDWARIARRQKREEAARALNHRLLNMSWDHSDGFLAIRSGRIAGADGAAVRAAIDRIADTIGPDETGTWEPLAKRRADALVQMAMAYLASDPDTNRATVVIHCTEDDLEHEDGTAKLERGPVVSSEVARRLACDGFLEVVIHGPDGTPVGIGRRSRVVPPSMMRELKRRDEGCAICGNTNASHAHHVIHWAHGGRTDLDNLVLLCWKCHRLVHEKGFRLTRNQHGVPLLVRPDGRPVRRTPHPLRPHYRERILGPPARVG